MKGLNDIMIDNVEVLTKARGLADAIELSLPKRIHIAALTKKSKIPLKVLIVRELLIHRVAPLATASIEFLENNKIVPAIVLVRAVMETVSVAFVLNNRVNSVLNTNKIIDLDEYLMSVIMGSRNYTGGRKSINIITMIDIVDKHVKGFRSAYDSLCEYTHPNWAGMLGAYGTIDKEQNDIIFGPADRSNGLRLGACTLVESLSIFYSCYNGLGDMFIKLNEYYEIDTK